MNKREEQELKAHQELFKLQNVKSKLYVEVGGELVDMIEVLGRILELEEKVARQEEILGTLERLKNLLE